MRTSGDEIFSSRRLGAKTTVAIVANRGRFWHPEPDMRSHRESPPTKSVEEPEQLVESVDRLTDELRSLGTVLESIREDVSWVTRNGLPVQPIEHVHVQRMARDPCAADWKERLAVERIVLHPSGQLSGLDSPDIDRIAEELRATIETLSHKQVEPVLIALDEVRAALCAAMQRQQGERTAIDPGTSTRSTTASASAMTPLSPTPPKSASNDAPSGQLF